MVGVCRRERRRKWREVPDGEALALVGVDLTGSHPRKDAVDLDLDEVSSEVSASVRRG